MSSREIAILHKNFGSEVGDFIAALDVLASNDRGTEIRAGAIALVGGDVDLFHDDGLWNGFSPGMAGIYFVARTSYLKTGGRKQLSRVSSRLHVPARCVNQCVGLADYDSRQPAPPTTHPDAPILTDVFEGTSDKLLPTLIRGVALLDVGSDVVHDAYMDLEDAGHRLIGYSSDMIFPRFDPAGQGAGVAN